MKCAYHPDKDATARCSECNKPFCDQCAIIEVGKPFICSRCAAIKAAQDMVQGIDQRLEEIEEKIQIQEAKKKRKSRVWLAFQWIIILACISVIAIQVPKIISGFTKEEKPIRYGTYSTDAQTDQCIRNLWHISKLLQEEELPGEEITCPTSKRPYVIINMEGNIVIGCPNPKKHGFKEIRISKKDPIPELRK